MHSRHQQPVPHSSRRQGQRGFALLLVFAMAAVVAITLYMQLPRVAFEAQRDRETILVQRGEEYKRAIELYVRKNNRYPARIEDLEREQDVRYLRRRYKDPLSGKDDWRLIHINAAGQLEDSLVKKAKTDADAKTNSTATAEELTGDENIAENIAIARQRSGDQVAANAAFPGGADDTVGRVQDSQQPTPDPNGLDNGLVPLLDASGNVIDATKTEANAQAQQRSTALGIAGTPANPLDPTSQAANPEDATKHPSSGRAPQVRLGPGGIPIIEDTAAAVAANGNGPLPGTAQPGATAANGQGSAGAGTGQTSAQSMLNNLLTRQVPGGLQGIQQRRGVQPGSTASQGFGAGIAGVASKYEMRGIKVYDEQESIHKWEFVYDARKEAEKRNQAANGQGQQGSGMNNGRGSNRGDSSGSGQRPEFGSSQSQSGGFGSGAGPVGSGSGSFNSGRPTNGRPPR